MSFEIHFVGRKKTLARIQAGEFSEEFAVQMGANPPSQTAEWRRQLAALTKRRKKVALPVWRRGRTVSRAWLFYRVGDFVFIQDRVFFRGFDAKKSRIPKREKFTDEGHTISEWSVSIEDIVDFLKKEPNQTLQTTPRGCAPRRV